MVLEQLKIDVVVRGPIFPEPVQVIAIVPMGASVKLIGRGLTTNLVHAPVLTPISSLNWRPAPRLNHSTAIRSVSVSASRPFARAGL